MPAYSDMLPTGGGRLLIVGGYGQVGRSVAERLAPLFPGRVIIAGRSREKAAATAAEIGHGAQAHAIDIFSADAELPGELSLALVCLDQTDTRFAERCLSLGIHYMDISADHAFLSRVEALDGLARRHHATALLSVGVAPGLTNMLAARAVARMARVDRVDIVLEIGLGDRHGRAAVEWMFDNLDAPFTVTDGGRAKAVRGFGESRALALPGQPSARPAYRFNFADQHVIPRTLDIPTASTWVRFDDRFTTWLFAKAARAGLGRLLRRPSWRKLAVWLFMNIHFGPDTCGVAVRADGRTQNGEETLTLGLIGRREARMTAIATAETARQLLTADMPSGVHHSEQLVDLEPMVSALRREFPDLVVEV